VSAQIRALGAVRDAVATAIKKELYNAEFNNGPLVAAGPSLAACHGLLSRAQELAQETRWAPVPHVSPAAGGADTAKL
jgi:hypothetical protein